MNGKVFHVNGLEDLALLKCPFYLNNLQIQCNPIKTLMAFFAKIGEKNPKIFIESQRTLNTQNNI